MKTRDRCELPLWMDEHDRALLTRARTVIDRATLRYHRCEILLARAVTITTLSEARLKASAVSLQGRPPARSD